MAVTGSNHPAALPGWLDLSGTGAPEGVITAAPGSTWLQTATTTDVKGWIRWVKATGTGNTGWQVGAEADTGWRNVAASFTPPGTGTIGAFNMRRVGSVVQFFLKYGSTAGAVGTHTLTGAVPTGFTPATQVPVFGIPGKSENGVISKSLGYYSGVFYVRNDDTNNSWGYIVGSYPAVAVWPTSLPGSPA